MSEPTPVVPRPAATVVFLRDQRDRCEVLLVQRSARMSFHAGSWVFPGGSIDPEDYSSARVDDHLAAARRAAVREAAEEAGITVGEEQLVPLSRWITPVESPKRFDTWFFVTRLEGDPVRVDGVEIRVHRWLKPDEALAAHHAGELDLPPPTFVTLHHLSRFDRTETALSELREAEPATFAPRFRPTGDGFCLLYGEDAAYDGERLDCPGPRHRLWIREAGWQYERTEPDVHD